MKSLVSIFVIVLSVGTYFYYIKPLTIDIKTKSAQKAEYDNVLNRVKEIKEKRDAVFSEYNSIPSVDIERLNKIIPSEVNSVGMLNDLSALASASGLKVVDYKVNNPNSSNREEIVSDGSKMYNTSSITLKINGQYNQFIKFLTSIESSLSLLDIVSLNVKQGSEKGSSLATMDYTLEANTYSLR